MACNDIAYVHLHEVELDVKAGLAGARTANYQHVFVDVVLGDFVAPHHDALRLYQENVLIEFGVDKGFDVLVGSP